MTFFRRDELRQPASEFTVYHNMSQNMVASPLFLDNDTHENLLDQLKDEQILPDFIDSLQNSDLCDVEYTVDIKYPPVPSKPFDHYGPPQRGDFSGQFNFDASITTDNGDKKRYVYSKELNRVYLGILAELPIEFKLDWNACNTHDLWIRATLILAGTEKQECRVLRCHNHKVANDSSNRDIPCHIHAHVLRSARQTDDVVYCGDEANDQKWLSVAFPLKKYPPRGSNSHSHVYQFCCKHSCTSGINRRKIEVLFTLEDPLGEIYGRKAVGVRVCSCPKRDMDKDLRELRPNNSGGPPSKRPCITKTMPTVTPTYHLPQQNIFDTSRDNSMLYNLNFQVLGRSTRDFILTCALKTMVADSTNFAPDTCEYFTCLECIEHIKNLINNPPSTDHPPP